MVSIVGLAFAVLYLLRAYNHLAHNLCHDGLGLIGSLLHFLMAHLNRIVEATKVGNHRDTKSTDATVVGHDNLGHSAHTYGVATKDTIHLIFCRRLEGWSLHTHIDTILQADLLLASNLTGQFDECRVVGLVHIREAWTRGEVLTTQRMLWEEVDVIGDDHQVANLEARVHTTSGIADEERLDAQLIHHTYWEGHFFHRIALIVVETTFHSHDINTSEFSEDEFSAMALYCRYREVGNITIGNFQCVSYL